MLYSLVYWLFYSFIPHPWIWSSMASLIHPFLHSFTQLYIFFIPLLINYFIHSTMPASFDLFTHAFIFFINAFIHLFIHAFINSCITSFIHPSMPSFIPLLIHSPIHLFMPSVIPLSIIYWFIHAFIRSFMFFFFHPSMPLLIHVSFRLCLHSSVHSHHQPFSFHLTVSASPGVVRRPTRSPQVAKTRDRQR